MTFSTALAVSSSSHIVVAIVFDVVYVSQFFCCSLSAFSPRAKQSDGIFPFNVEYATTSTKFGFSFVGVGVTKSVVFDNTTLSSSLLSSEFTALGCFEVSVAKFSAIALRLDGVGVIGNGCCATESVLVFVLAVLLACPVFSLHSAVNRTGILVTLGDFLGVLLGIAIDAALVCFFILRCCQGLGETTCVVWLVFQYVVVMTVPTHF